MSLTVVCNHFIYTRGVHFCFQIWSFFFWSAVNDSPTELFGFLNQSNGLPWSWIIPKTMSLGTTRIHLSSFTRPFASSLFLSCLWKMKHGWMAQKTFMMFQRTIQWWLLCLLCWIVWDVLPARYFQVGSLLP